MQYLTFYSYCLKALEPTLPPCELTYCGQEEHCNSKYRRSGTRPFLAKHTAGSLLYIRVPLVTVWHTAMGISSYLTLSMFGIVGFVFKRTYTILDLSTDSRCN